MKLEGYPNKDFFVLDSAMPLAGLSAFFGYWYDEKSFNIRTNPGRLLDKLTAGAFVNIQSDGENVVIQQDYSCHFGVFVFRQDKYWAISNSFYALVRHIAPGHKLEVNDEYVEAFIYGFYPSIIKETAIKQIEEITQGQYLVIDIKGKNLAIKRYDYAKATIPLQSEAAIALIDKWHAKYSRIIQGLHAGGYNIFADLTGGFDSRAALSILFKPNIYKDITLYAPEDNVSFHKEDYALASRIADIYGMKRENIKYDGTGISSYNSLLNAFNAQLFSSNQIGFKSVYYKLPVFNINGNGGEDLRDYYHYWDAAEYIAYNAPDSTKMGRKVGEKARKILWRSAQYILNNYKEAAPDGQKIHTYVGRKNHFGRTAITGFLANLVSVEPCMDPRLMDLALAGSDKPDLNIFMALVYTRFIPETSDIGFNAGRSIKPETWEIARRINKEFPYRPRSVQSAYEISVSSCPEPGWQMHSQTRSPATHLMEIFNSRAVREFIEREYGAAAYDASLKEIKPDIYNGYGFAIRAVSQWLIAREIGGQNSDFPYAPLYARDGITDNLCQLSPGIDIAIKLEFAGRSKNFKAHALESPALFTFATEADGVAKIQVAAPCFQLSGQRLPYMIDLLKIAIIDQASGAILREQDSVYCVGRAGYASEFAMSKGQKLELRIEWAPNELWWFDGLAAAREAGENFNRRFARATIPGADRQTNLYNM